MTIRDTIIMMTTIGIKEKNKKLKTPCTFRIIMLQWTPEREAVMLLVGA